MIAFVFTTSIAAFFEVLFYWHRVAEVPVTASVASFLSVILLALWVDAHSKSYPQIERPFEYGYLVALFWVPYLPYYFWRTRGIKGVAMLAGLIGLLFMGVFVDWAIYGYSAH